MLLSKKSKDLIPTQAQAEGIPEEDLQDMVNGFWKAIRDTLENMGYTQDSNEPNLQVYVDGFGTFRLIKHRVVTTLPETERIFRKWKSPKRRATVEQYKAILRAFDQEYEQKQMMIEQKLLYKQGYELDTEPVEVDGKLQYLTPGHIYPDMEPSTKTYDKGCHCRACKGANATKYREARARRKQAKLQQDGTKGHTTEGLGEQK